MELAPKRAGFAPERINRITEHLDRNYVAPGKIAGCQTLVARHGHVAYFKSQGLMDRERGKPIADDTIFRIYSMTKPIASVALMTLFEQGHFQLNDPVSRFIPAWRDHKVWVSGEGATMETAAPAKPMTMRHVLSHSGRSYLRRHQSSCRSRLSRGRRRSRRGRDTWRVRREAREGTPALSAGRAMDVLPFDRRLRLPGRGDHQANGLTSIFKRRFSIRLT